MSFSAAGDSEYPCARGNGTRFAGDIRDPRGSLMNPSAKEGSNPSLDPPGLRMTHFGFENCYVSFRLGLTAGWEPLALGFWVRIKGRLAFSFLSPFGRIWLRGLLKIRIPKSFVSLRGIGANRLTGFFVLLADSMRDEIFCYLAGFAETKQLPLSCWLL